MTHHDFELPRDSDRLVGELFRRLHIHRDLGEEAFARAVHAALIALGRAAQDEGERRARTATERARPRPTDIRVTPFADRRSDMDGEGRC